MSEHPNEVEQDETRSSVAPGVAAAMREVRRVAAGTGEVAGRVATGRLGGGRRTVADGDGEASPDGG
ncbi:hypothetical protein FHX42_001259 [Saccharopolyspora lacisalsi]|uniref:Uncharacterized protein n=1 Tax=Halosaccharopolyspora lacisalsi TaxID=1000566 RepID=A0A839DSJ5_9PSEU|nr:hypothetical protein [Halosaccharopolyspora lacisalsi]MBA8823930.1 hypothetical protein [Halosaccharopolyspora lacisalsi]